MSLVRHRTTRYPSNYPGNKKLFSRDRTPSSESQRLFGSEVFSLNLKSKMATSNAMKSCATKLTKAEKKALRKQTRLINSLRRNNADLATVSESPTRHLMVGNGGFMCGIDRRQIFSLFQKFGNIERLLMFPGRSFSFITFEHVSESVKAMEKVHGRVLDCPSEFPRPDVRFYLSFLTNVPDNVSFEKQATPSGLVLVDDFVTEVEEAQLIQALGWRRGGREWGGSDGGPWHSV